MPPARKKDLKPQPSAAKPTVSSLAEQMRVLDESIKALDKHFARQARGTELANNRSAKLERRADTTDERIGALETSASFLMERLGHFSGFFRTAQEDTALHEQRITRLERATDSEVGAGAWFLRWFVVVAVWIAGVFLFWLNFNQNYYGARHDTFANGVLLVAGIGVLVISITVLYLAASSGSGYSSSATAETESRSTRTTQVQTAVQSPPAENWWETADSTDHRGEAGGGV